MRLDARSALLGAVAFSPAKALRVVRRLGSVLVWWALGVVVLGRLAWQWWEVQAWWLQALLIVAVLALALRVPLAKVGRRQLRRPEPPRALRDPIPGWLRQQVIERDDGICGICGFRVRPGQEHIDHVHPVHAGGTNDPSNLQTAHDSCNLRKGGMVGWTPPYRRESA